MAHLLNKPVHHPLSDDVQVIHDLQPNDINLDYIGLKVLDIKSGGNYEEATEDFELCIVALTGKVTVSDGTNTFEHIGTRDSVFEKIPILTPNPSRRRREEAKGIRKRKGNPPHSPFRTSEALAISHLSFLPFSRSAGYLSRFPILPPCIPRRSSSH